MELGCWGHQGWESLPETMMCYRGTLPVTLGAGSCLKAEKWISKYLRRVKASLHLFWSRNHLLELMEHLAVRRNLGPWVNERSRMLGKLCTPNPFSFLHLFRWLGKDLESHIKCIIAYFCPCLDLSLCLPKCFPTYKVFWSQGKGKSSFNVTCPSGIQSPSQCTLESGG